jgi:hypothetical protein
MIRSSGDTCRLIVPFSCSTGIMLSTHTEMARKSLKLSAAPAVATCWMIGISPPAKNEARSPEIVTSVGSANTRALRLEMMPWMVGLTENLRTRSVEVLSTKVGETSKHVDQTARSDTGTTRSTKQYCLLQAEWQER